MSEDEGGWTEVRRERPTLSDEQIEERRKKRLESKRRLKEAKKFKREEEIRRQKLAPKDSRIQVISQSAFSRIGPSSSYESRSPAPLLPSAGGNESFSFTSQSNEEISKRKKSKTFKIAFEPSVKVKQSVLKKERAASFRPRTSRVPSAKNPLDSSAPVHKGKKQKLTNKKKKPTKLKKIMLREKAERLKQREEVKEEEKVINVPEDDPPKSKAVPTLERIQEDKEAQNVVEKKDIVIQESSSNKKQSSSIWPLDPSKTTDQKQKNIPKDGNENSPVAQNKKPRRCGSYCNHNLSSDLDTHVNALIKDTVFRQDRMYAINPTKANANRLYVIGIRNVKKLVLHSAVKLVIIAPDADKSKSVGGLFDEIEQIKSAAEERSIPVIFSLSKRKLAYIMYRKMIVTCVGIVNISESNPNFVEMMKLFPILKEEYRVKKGLPLKEETSAEDRSSPSFDEKETVLEPETSAINQKMIEILKMRQ